VIKRKSVKVDYRNRLITEYLHTRIIFQRNNQRLCSSKVVKTDAVRPETSLVLGTCFWSIERLWSTLINSFSAFQMITTVRWSWPGFFADSESSQLEYHLVKRTLIFFVMRFSLDHLQGPIRDRQWCVLPFCLSVPCLHLRGDRQEQEIRLPVSHVTAGWRSKGQWSRWPGRDGKYTTSCDRVAETYTNFKLCRLFGSRDSYHTQAQRPQRSKVKVKEDV